MPRRELNLQDFHIIVQGLRLLAADRQATPTERTKANDLADEFERVHHGLIDFDAEKDGDKR